MDDQNTEAIELPNPSDGPISGMPPLVIGEPFAILEGVEALDAPPPGARTVHPGCVLTLRCEGAEQPCGQAFKVNLLRAGPKTCPRCKRQYTHLLLFAPLDDDDIIADAMEHVLEANGYQLPGRPADDDDQGDEDEPE